MPTGGASISFSGNGSVLVEDDFLIGSGSGRTITLNAAGGFAINGDLVFEAASSDVTLVNQQPLSVSSRILFSTNNVMLVNNSSITTGSVVVNGSTNNGNAIINNAAGTINTGVINLNNGNFTLNNYGEINQTGNFNNVDNGSAFNNLDGSTWNFSGGGSNTRLFCNNGLNTFNYNATGAQNIFVPADAYSNLILSGSGNKSLTGNLDVNSNLIIEDDASLDVASSPFNLSLAGDWINASGATDPFRERTGSVTLDGTSTQTILSVSGTETFYNLVINNSGGNVVQSSSTPTNVTVSNTLSLTNGALELNGQTLAVTRSAANAISRTNGCIISETNTPPYSNIQWSVGTASGSFVFPFGRTSAPADYIPFTFTVTTPGSSATGTVSLSTYSATPANVPLPQGVADVNLSPGVDNSSNVVDRFWIITLDNYATNPVATVTFTATPDEVGSITALRAQRWNATASAWDPPLPGQNNPTAYSAVVTGVSNFSPWTLSGNNISLPIELVYFNAMPKGDVVEIEWKTSMESNNDFFTVEKTIDAERYNEVAMVHGAGTTNRERVYKVTDTDPWRGISYYRLKQTDLDGTVRHYKPVVVNYQPSVFPRLAIFPVPSDGSDLYIELSSLKSDEPVSVEILNSQGEIVYSVLIELQGSVNTRRQLAFKNHLAAGVYILTVGQTLKQKFIVR